MATHHSTYDAPGRSQPACPICGSSAPTKYGVKDGRELRICRDCRHIFWAQMPSDEQLHAFYASEYTEGHGQEEIQAANIEYYRHHAVDLVTKHGGAALCIADVGCSLPLFLEQALAVGFNTAIGVDYSQEARDYGERRGIQVMSPGEFDQIENDSLDVLRYSHSLEHMVNPMDNLVKASRKVRAGGLLHITQPNFPVFKATESSIPLKDSVWPNHLHFFNPVSLKYMVEAAGFRLVSFCTVTEEQSCAETYGQIADVDYSVRMLKSLEAIGEHVRGKLNNFPYYYGENSVAFARKPASLTSRLNAAGRLFFGKLPKL